MLGIVWSEDEVPTHHDDMLIVRVKPSAAGTMRHVSARAPEMRRDAPGLSALARMERSGHLAHIHALDGRAHAKLAAGRSVADSIRAAARHHVAGLKHTGAMILRVTHARHLSRLRESLKRDPHLEWVAPVPARYLFASRGATSASKAPGDADMPALRMWNHKAVRLAEARALPGFREPRRIHVAVIDSGVDLGHPALHGRVRRYVHRFGAHHTSPLDIVGHGTHVTGIIAARQNALGVGGMCTCRVSVYKVFDAETYLVRGLGKPLRLYLVDPILYRAALANCLEDRVDVINMSLGGAAPPDPHEEALFEHLIESGSVIVSAMGNAFTHRDRASYPAAIPGVIAVGALKQDESAANFSCTGRHITLCAPGVDIWSTLPFYDGGFGFNATKSGQRSLASFNPLERNTRYDAWPGTSMACPQVSAAVAMLLATRGKMSPAEVKRRLMRTADRLPGMRGRRFTATFGGGRLNLVRLLSE